MSEEQLLPAASPLVPCSFCQTALIRSELYCHHCGRNRNLETATVSVLGVFGRVFLGLALFGVSGFLFLLGACINNATGTGQPLAAYLAGSLVAVLAVVVLVSKG